MSWLNKLLWCGVILLAVEHIWHGEVIPWPPFVTAMGNQAGVAPMLNEMATIGVAMALFVTIIWAIIVLIVELKAKAMPEAKVSPAGGVE